MNGDESTAGLISNEPGSSLKDWLLDELGWCGCWESEPLVVFRDYLRMLGLPDGLEGRECSEAWDKAWAENKERWLLSKDPHVVGLSYLLEGTCERLDLTEHGTSCRGSWLTDKGKEVLAMLDGVEDFDAWTEADDE